MIIFARLGFKIRVVSEGVTAAISGAIAMDKPFNVETTQPNVVAPISPVSDLGHNKLCSANVDSREDK
jgi:hypothetical protein